MFSFYYSQTIWDKLCVKVTDWFCIKPKIAKECKYLVISTVKLMIKIAQIYFKKWACKYYLLKRTIFQRIFFLHFFDKRLYKNINCRKKAIMIDCILMLTAAYPKSDCRIKHFGVKATRCKCIKTCKYFSFVCVTYWYDYSTKSDSFTCSPKAPACIL